MTSSVLLVADQPYQARLLARVGEALMAEGYKIHLAFSDWYMFIYQSELLQDIASRGIEVHTMGEDFSKWQGTVAGNQGEMKKALRLWEEENCLDRDLKTLELTNNFVYANERDYFALTVSEDWKTRILFDSVRWVENLFDRLDVDIVLAIENCTLLNNLMFTKAQKLGVPYLVAMNSRIGSRWVVRDDFGFGMSARTLERVKESQNDRQARLGALRFVDDFQKHSVGAYQSVSQIQLEKTKSSGYFRVLLREAVDVASKAIYRAIEAPVRHRFIRLEQNFTRLSVWEARAIWRKAREVIFSNSFNFYAAPEDQKYFLWCLHHRPEGSVLTASQGHDEIDLLEKASRLLPEGVRLLVKEHPLMFGFRDPDFFRRLGRMRNVSTVSHEVSTKSLILQAQGVLGIAGTALIEAQMLGRPAWTLGRPEFEPFIHGSGFASLTNFLSGSSLPSEEECRKQVLEYITFVFSNSAEYDTWIGDHLVPFELQDLEPNVLRLEQEVKTRV